MHDPHASVQGDVHSLCRPLHSLTLLLLIASFAAVSLNGVPTLLTVTTLCLVVAIGLRVTYAAAPIHPVSPASHEFWGWLSLAADLVAVLSAGGFSRIALPHPRRTAAHLLPGLDGHSVKFGFAFLVSALAWKVVHMQARRPKST